MRRFNQRRQRRLHESLRPEDFAEASQIISEYEGERVVLTINSKNGIEMSHKGVLDGVNNTGRDIFFNIQNAKYFILSKTVDSITFSTYASLWIKFHFKDGSSISIQSK